MNRPSITPHSDAVEIAIRDMQAALDEQAKDTSSDPISIALSRAILPVCARAMATQLDAGHSGNDVMYAFIATFANAITSTVASITGYSPGSPGLSLNMIQIVPLLLEQIRLRCVSCDPAAVTKYNYDAAPPAGSA